MLAATQTMDVFHVFVSTDFKYFKVADKYCSHSPCKEIVAMTQQFNVVSYPVHFITPVNGATMALALSIGNVPFEMTLKSSDETLKIFQNLVTYQEVTRIVGEISNILTFQQLYAFYASVFEEQRREILQPEQNHHQDVMASYTVQEDTSASTETLTEAEILELFDLDLKEDEDDSQSLDDFLESLCKTNVNNDMDMF